ncbi:MAG: dihydrodipicolinate synthase family protein [Chloroflexi bacterium]|nr:dihydrodipicolinate synthase family protein [Ardenticatenaceae bacterium]NOG32969.1 dihydrodipicolinate synthase family protein [Chloroflexota bacterium]
MIKRIAELKNKLSGGVTPAMATPVLADGYTVNTAVIPQLADFLIQAGVRGLFVGGTTGEGVLLAETERMRLHEAALAAADGRVPVILHIGTNRLDTAVTLARHAAELGADAIAVVTPYFYGMDDDGLAAYYETLAASVPELPLLLYDIPQMATNGISPELFARLGNSIPSLAGIKTSRGDAQIIRRHIVAAPERAMVLVGNEAIALGSLAMGAHGLISGLSTAVPEPFVALTAAFAAGNLTEAQRQHRLINRLLPCLPAGARIGGIKQILTERGLDVGTAVPPRAMPDKPIWPVMVEIMRDA